MAILFTTPETVKNTTSRDLEYFYKQPKLQDKAVNYNQNKKYVITPDEGYDGLSKVDVTVNVPTSKVQDKKVYTATLGKNTINPDSGFDSMKQVEVTVNLQLDITQAVVNLSYFKGSQVPSNVIGWENLVDGSYKVSRSSLTEFTKDTPKLNDGSYMFYNNILLETFTGNLSALTKSDNMFSECMALKNITLKGTLNVDLNLASTNSILITKESLISVMNALVTLSGETKNQTFGTTLLAKLSEEEKKIATDKGWTLK